MKFKATTLFFCIIIQTLFSQTSKVDSLEALLPKAKHDTTRASLLAQIGFEIKFSDPEKSKKLAEEALALSIKAKYKITEAAANNVLGVYYYLKQDFTTARLYFIKTLNGYTEVNFLKGMASSSGNIGSTFNGQAMFDSAIYYQEMSLEYSKKLNNEKSIATSYQNLGNTYNMKGDYKLSSEYLFKSLKVFEKVKDNYGINMAYYNIGRAFFMQGKHPQAIEYAKKCRKIRTEMNDKSGIATTYILEASALYQLKKFQESSEAVNKAIAIQEEIGDTVGLQYSFSILGNIFHEYRQFDLSIEYYLKSRKIAEEIGNKQTIANLDYSIGAAYTEKGDYKKAIEYQLNSLKLSKELDVKEELKNSYLALSQTYAKMKNFEKAYEYVNEYMATKDSLLNETNTKQLNELETQYESEKKQKEIELLTKDQEVKDERIARQNTITYAMIGGLLLVVGLAFLSYKRYREKKKANLEITLQKEIIEEKQREIIDSIKYAKRIQHSLMPTEIYISKTINRLKK